MLRRGGTSPEAHESSLPADDDMLREILVRLPPQPSSIPRAAAVCKRWQRVTADTQFLRRFRAHHGKPPLVGAFVCSDQEIVFTPTLKPTDGVVPPQCFSIGRNSSSRNDVYLLGYRHGLILVKDRLQQHVVVYDPIAGEQYRLAVPPEVNTAQFFTGHLSGAVLCDQGSQQVHNGRHHSRPFKVVVVSTCRFDNRPRACVYSSETGVWGNVISTETPCENFYAYGNSTSTLVGNVLYWVFSSIYDGILEFDLEKQSLDFIEGPPGASDLHTHLIVQPEDGGALGFATFSHSSFRMWRRNVDHHGVAAWLLHKTVDVHNMFRLPTPTEAAAGWREMVILGHDEDNSSIFLYVDRKSYMLVDLKSMQPRKLINGTHHTINQYHPFKSFHIPGQGSAATVFNEFVALDQCGLKYFYVV